MGGENGSFIISRREVDGSLSSEVIDQRPAKPERWFYHRNKDGKIIRKEPIEKIDYDPRTRPWYKLAKEKGTSVWSSAYIFYSGVTQTLGITSASPVIIDGKFVGAVGIDMKLASISKFLENQKISENGIAFIADEKGTLIAYPGYADKMLHVDTVGKKWIKPAFDKYKTTGEKRFDYKYKGYRYHTSVFTVPGFDLHKWRIFIIVPEEDIIGPIRRANIQTLMLSGLLLILGLGFISLLARRISGPIHSLADDLERVKNFDIDTSKMLDSRVKEVFEMSKAIHGMKVGLESFQKYVPRLLVRRLISSGEAAYTGGRRQDLTVMFSDIENFTAFSEGTEAEEIMLQMCDYFDAVAKGIDATKGTVDKYIGDSVMAFWGAPEKDQEHIKHACESALLCQQALAEQNSKWKAENKQTLLTRIGIHTGEVVIGNLGSSNRINYTAIGDTVNTSSRLEQINKIYGTYLIVSEAVYKAVSNEFIFRLLDNIVVKGRHKSDKIYELIDFKNDENESKYRPYCEAFEAGVAAYQAKQWDEAIKYFESVLSQKPDDKASELYIHRCHDFKEKGVPDDWNGVWVYAHKDSAE